MQVSYPVKTGKAIGRISTPSPLKPARSLLKPPLCFVHEEHIYKRDSHLQTIHFKLRLIN